MERLGQRPSRREVVVATKGSADISTHWCGHIKWPLLKYSTLVSRGLLSEPFTSLP